MMKQHTTHFNGCGCLFYRKDYLISIAMDALQDIVDEHGPVIGNDGNLVRSFLSREDMVRLADRTLSKIEELDFPYTACNPCTLEYTRTDSSTNVYICSVCKQLHFEFEDRI